MDRIDLVCMIAIATYISRVENKPLSAISIEECLDEYNIQCKEYFEDLDSDYWAEQLEDEQYACL